MVTRRQLLLASAAALPLAACDADVALQQIVATIQKDCGFLTTWQNIASVVVTIVTTFDASAGAAATVATQVANQVVMSVCNAFKAAEKPQGPLSGGEPPKVTVIVNGVPVTGVVVGKGG